MSEFLEVIMKITINRNEAINACLMNSFKYEDGKEILHCFLGFIGADWDLNDVIKLIQDESVDIYFSDFSLSKLACLHVLTKNKLYIFDDVHMNYKE